jgi:hypothetical protein
MPSPRLSYVALMFSEVLTTLAFGGLAIVAAPIFSLWLPLRWLRSRPAPERWLGLAAVTPFAVVPLHWWWYPSDSVLAHLWFASLQVVAFFTPIWVSGRLSGTHPSVSRRDQRVGLATTALAGACLAMCFTLFGEDGGTLYMLAPAFMANPPKYWWTAASHSWLVWFVAATGLIVSSVAMRRGRVIGYIGLALVASLMALAHWDHYQVDAGFDATIGSVAVMCLASGACWLLVGHRVLAHKRT